MLGSLVYELHTSGRFLVMWTCALQLQTHTSVQFNTSLKNVKLFCEKAVSSETIQKFKQSITRNDIDFYIHQMALNKIQIAQLNECTEVQNPRYKDVTLNAYTLA